MTRQKSIALLLASLLGLSSFALANHHGEKKEEVKKVVYDKIRER